MSLNTEVLVVLMFTNPLVVVVVVVVVAVFIVAVDTGMTLNSATPCVVHTDIHCYMPFWL